MADRFSGGCMCGRVRYDAEVSDRDAYLCHCRMCQRTSGAVSLAMKTIPKSKRHWHCEPDWFASSPFARRPFCAACGTSLGFEYLDSDKCDITIGSLDDPAPFVPSSNFGIESRHDAWSDTSALPGTRCDSYDRLVQRWTEAGLEMPE